MHFTRKYWVLEEDVFSSVRETGTLGKRKSAYRLPTGVEPMTFRFTSWDALPLSYRRLSGAKATLLRHEGLTELVNKWPSCWELNLACFPPGCFPLGLLLTLRGTWYFSLVCELFRITYGMIWMNNVNVETCQYVHSTQDTLDFHQPFLDVYYCSVIGYSKKIILGIIVMQCIQGKR